MRPVAAHATDADRSEPDPARSAGRDRVARRGRFAAVPLRRERSRPQPRRPESITPLPAADQASSIASGQTAVAAAARLDTAAKANAAGYVVASTNAPGVGVHFVKWSLIDKPFDPAAPSMLLFDVERRRPVLAGFSYWVHSDDAPAGFAGANDHWHQHSGLCIVNGWVDREEVDGPSLCARQLPRRERSLDVARVGRARLREPLG